MTDVKPTTSPQLREMRGTRWLANQLNLPLSWDAGVTTPGCRRARLRKAIVEQERTDLHAHFLRLFGVPVDVTETDFAPMEPVR